MATVITYRSPFTENGARMCYRLSVYKGMGEWIAQTALGKFSRNLRKCPPTNLEQHCGSWYSFARGSWGLETCADRPDNCICEELRGSSVDQLELLAPIVEPTLWRPDDHAVPSTSRESRRALLVAVIKSKQEEVDALCEEWRDKEFELASLRAKLQEFDVEELTPTRGLDLPVLAPPEPTTPSWLLAKSVKDLTTLKAIDEGEECNFSREFSRPLHEYFPFCPARREQGGRLFDGTESTLVVSPFSHCLDFSSDCESLSISTSSTSLLSSSGSITELVVKMEFPEVMIHPLPTTPSHCLVKSVQKNTALKPIVEEEESDFTDEFTQVLPTFTPLSLIPRKQGENQFSGKEATMIASSFSFLQGSQLISPDNNSSEQTVADDTNQLESASELAAKLEFVLRPLPTTPSHCLVKSVQKHTALKPIVEEEESDFTDEFTQALPTFTPLSLIPRKQGEDRFSGKEATVAASSFSFLQGSCQVFTDEEQSASIEQALTVDDDEKMNEEQSACTEQALTVNKKRSTLVVYPFSHCVDFSSDCESLSASTSSTSLLSSSGSITELVVKMEFPEGMIHPLPTTPSHCLVKSVQKHTALKPIVEEEESDFTDEFTQALPTFTPLSLIPREQGEDRFSGKEATVAASSFSFLQGSCQVFTDEEQSASIEQALTVDDEQSACTEQALTVDEEQSACTEQALTVNEKRSTLVVCPFSHCVDFSSDCESLSASTSSTSLLSSSGSITELVVKMEFPEVMIHPLPTTPSHCLVKSVQKNTALKPIFEEEESDFTDEFTQVLPTFTPLSLIPREQGEDRFSGKEATMITSSFSFLQGSPLVSPDDKSSEQTVADDTNQLESASELAAKLEFVLRPLPTTPSHCLVKSVQKHTALKPIIEEEESDFTDEFTQTLPTFTPLSLIPRKQGEDRFSGKEATVAASSFSFLQGSCQVFTDEEQSASTEQALTVDDEQSASTEQVLAVNEKQPVSADSDDDDVPNLVWEQLCREVTLGSETRLLWIDREMHTESYEKPCKCNLCRVWCHGLHPLPNNPLKCLRVKFDSTPTPKRSMANTKTEESTHEKKMFNAAFNIKRPGFPRHCSPSRVVQGALSCESETGSSNASMRGERRSREVNGNGSAFQQQLSPRSIMASRRRVSTINTYSSVSLGRRVESPTSLSTFTSSQQRGRHGRNEQPRRARRTNVSKPPVHTVTSPAEKTYRPRRSYDGENSNRRVHGTERSRGAAPVPPSGSHSFTPSPQRGGRGRNEQTCCAKRTDLNDSPVRTRGCYSVVTFISPAQKTYRPRQSNDGGSSSGRTERSREAAPVRTRGSSVTSPGQEAHQWRRSNGSGSSNFREHGTERSRAATRTHGSQSHSFPSSQQGRGREDSGNSSSSARGHFKLSHRAGAPHPPRQSERSERKTTPTQRKRSERRVTPTQCEQSERRATPTQNEHKQEGAGRRRGSTRSFH